MLRLHRRSIRLLIIFAIYLAMIAAFAGLYYGLFLHRPDAFAFNKDILDSQREAFRIRAVVEEANLTLQLRLLTSLRDRLSKKLEMPASRPSTAVFYVDDYELAFEHEVISGGYIAGHERRLLFRQPGHSDPTFSLHIDNAPELPGGPMDYLVLVVDVIAEREAAVKDVRRRIATIDTAQPEVWNYWDFLYFSTITQATIGYGDILPNSTTARVLVTTQSLLTAALLIVLIDLAFIRRAVPQHEIAKPAAP